MRFLADENLPGRLVAALRAAGHDVTWVRNTAPGIDDTAVLALAAAERRVLVTFDKGFGELTARELPHPDCGVVLLRMRLRDAADAVPHLAALIGDNAGPGHLTVIQPGRVRRRPLRKSP